MRGLTGRLSEPDQGGQWLGARPWGFRPHLCCSGDACRGGNWDIRAERPCRVSAHIRGLGRDILQKIRLFLQV